jgi:lipoate-protein ligase B
LHKQEKVHEEIRSAPQRVCVLGQEHFDVLTLGYRAEKENEILTLTYLPVIRASRGGLATIHSRGQLVIYPIMHLKHWQIGVRDYVCLLLKTTQDVLKIHEIESFFDDRSVGLYTDKGKIAFCGIQIKNGVSLHGISLNVSNDLSLFKCIVPCGAREQSLDSMAAHLSATPELKKLFTLWVNSFLIRLEQLRN